MSAGAAPRIAVVVVHYGDPEPTRRCLDSLDGQGEVILVDQPPHLCGPHPRTTKRIEPGTNLGFAAACNAGVAATEAPFVLILNNDALLEPGAARALTAAIPSLAPDVAGASVKLLCLDGTTLQSAGGLGFTADGIGYPYGFGEVDLGQYDVLAAEKIGVPSGAAAVYRTSAWREAGGMTDEFFCYCEDGDLGLRLVALGYRFTWLPSVRVRHALSSSSGTHSAFKIFQVERNRLLTLLHVAPWPVIGMSVVHTLSRLLLSLLHALRGRGAAGAAAERSSAPTLAATVLRAWWSAARAASRSLTRRHAILRAHPQGSTRVGRFLRAHRVALSTFLVSRDIGSSDA